MQLVVVRRQEPSQQPLFLSYRRRRQPEQDYAGVWQAFLRRRDCQSRDRS